MTGAWIWRGLERCAAGIVLLALVSCAREFTQSATTSWAPGTTEHVVAVASDERQYLLHVPALRPRNRLGVTRPFPLIILLHGSGADGETVRRQSQIEKLADSLRFVVAYPNGSRGLLGFGSDWNAGTCCGSAARGQVDDVAFIKAVIAEVSRRMPIDPRRVFVAGFSDGARMAYRMGCDAAQVVAAIGVVSGSLTDDSCSPARPVPLIAFHGTADSEVPYDDSARTGPRAAPPPASSGLPPAVRFWSSVDRCSSVSSARISEHVVRSLFAPCAGGDVVLYTVEEGRHAWPGGEKDGSDGQEPTSEIRATDMMVQFFLRHPRR